MYARKQERIKQGKKITATDDRYFKQAEEVLYSVLTVCTCHTIKKYLSTNFLDKNTPFSTRLMYNHHTYKWKTGDNPNENQKNHHRHRSFPAYVVCHTYQPSNSSPCCCHFRCSYHTDSNRLFPVRCLWKLFQSGTDGIR